MRARQIGLSVMAGALSVAGNISSGGQFLAADGAVGAPSYSWTSQPSTGIYRPATSDVRVSLAGADVFRFVPTGVIVTQAGSLSWGSSNVSSPDLQLFRDAANTLAQRNSTNAQVTRVYNTWTDASNGEWLEFSWVTAANNMIVRTVANGSGSARTIIFRYGNTASNGLAINTGQNGGVAVSSSASSATAMSSGLLTIGANAAFTALSGTNIGINFPSTLSFSDGGTTSSTVVIGIALAPTINYSAAAKTGQVYCIYINPTNTSLPTGVNAGLAFSTTASGLTGAILLHNQADETTNFEYGSITWAANVLCFSTVKGGGGTVRSMAFFTGGVQALAIDSSSNIIIGSTADVKLSRVSQAGSAGWAWTINGTLSSSPADFNLDDTSTTLAGAFTVTRLNVMNVRQPAGAVTITDMCLLRVDAAAGTHKMVDAGTTKTSPGTVTQWVKINVNGTLAYIPSYSSKTS